MMKSYLKTSPFTTAMASLATVILMLSCGTVYAAEKTNEASTDTHTHTASDGRPLYTEENRPDFPVFNSMIGEENFLSIIDSDGVVTDGGGDSLELFPGQEYEVVISYHNNGLPRGITTRAIANDTTVQVSFPETITNEREMVATISARDAQPASISCSLTLVASEAMKLEVIPGTARIVNSNQTNDSLISTESLFGDGTLIGTNSMVGIVLYGPENAGSVVFTFRTVPLIQKPTNSQSSTSLASPTISTDSIISEQTLIYVVMVGLLFVVMIIIVIAYLAYIQYITYDS